MVPSPLPPPPVDVPARLAEASAAARRAGVDAVLITPGATLRHLCGYGPPPLERLTCLVVRSSGDPVLVVPGLEEPAALASPLGGAGVAVHPWAETDDPYRLVASLLGPGAGPVALEDSMPAVAVLRLRAALPDREQQLAGPLLRALRLTKSSAEVAALAEAGAAIDAVHAAVPQLLRVGATEREVGAVIGQAILDAGHAGVDFVIVASGPNGASPHHELSDRRLADGDVVVVDIGGVMPSGYRSDCTRTYALGAPPADFVEAFAVLRAAQDAGCAAAAPGVPAQDVDAAARAVIAQAGYGERFIHRTGHGIGLETHEDPYLVAGNEERLGAGMVFSVEPGIYTPGRWGSRIEDIVAVTADGAERLNHAVLDLVVVGG